MAGENVIKNKIVLEGEAKYKKEMAEISRVLKENKAAAKAAAAEYDAAEGSMTAMYRQGDALERVLETQAEALRLMHEQLDKTEAAYGKNSREATELRTRINNMRAEMARTETQVRQFYQRMDEATDAMQKTGDAAKETVQGFDQIEDGAQAARDGVGDLIADMEELAGIKIGNLIGGVGGLAGAAALIGEALTLGDGVTKAWNQIENYTGATGKNLEDLQTAAENLYKKGFGENLGEAAQGIATVNSYTRATGEDLEKSTEAAMMLDDVFGMDIPESARAASQLMTSFGLTGEQAYALIATAAQEGADKNGNLLDTINEYAPYFQQAGKGAEEFGAALSLASENGVYDVDKVGDAMKEFTIRIGEDSETTKKALQDLGLEATDLPGKFSQGGETASAAFDLVIDALKNVEDPLERNRLGIALFGTQWEDTGGAVLTIFDTMGERALDTTGTLEAMNETRMEDLGEQLERVGNRAELAAGKLMQPFSSGLAGFLAEVSDAADETGSTWLDALGAVILEKSDTALDAMGTVLGMGEESPVIAAAKSAGTLAGEAWGEGYAEKIAEIAKDPETTVALEPVAVEMDDLFEAHSDAAGSGDESLAADLQAEIDAQASAAIQAMREGKKRITIDDLFEARSQAAGEGNLELVAELDAIIEQAIAATKTGGEDAGQALIDGWTEKQPDMTQAAEETGEEAVMAIEDAAPDMEIAGEELGESAEEGLEEGVDGMYDAAVSAVDGAISGMNTGLSRAYEAGAALGGAFLAGYRAKMMIHSPSRVMYDAAGDTVDGALERFEEERQRLYAAAADLGDAVALGYSESGSGYAMDAGGAGGMDAQELADVLIQALSGLGLYCNGERVGELTEMGASRATRNRLMATVRGQSSAVKGW